MSVLVTGAGGMIGSHLVEQLHSENIKVIGTFYKPTINMKELPKTLNLYECDVRYPDNLEILLRKFKPDEIYHLAAQSFPVVSWEKPYETFDTNVIGTVSLFQSIKKIKSENKEYNPVVVVACSSAEYGQTLNELENPYVLETAELKPLHPYGVSKVAQDLLAYQYWINDSIKTFRARIFNTTGPRKINDVVSDLIKRVVFLEKSNFSSLDLEVGNLNSKRAILDYRDLIQALRLLSKSSSFGEAFNISSKHIYSIMDIIETIEDILGKKFNLVSKKELFRPSDEKIIVGDVTKLTKLTNWDQKVPFKKTINDIINYWRKYL